MVLGTGGLIDGSQGLWIGRLRRLAITNSRGVRGLPTLEGWLGQSPAARETLRILIDRPAGSPITELERKGGDPKQVVRTLHELQTAGLLKLHVEQTTHELVAKVPEHEVERVRGLLGKLS